MTTGFSSFKKLSFALITLILPLKLWAIPDWNVINTRLFDVAKDHVRAFDFIHDAHANIELAETDWQTGNLGFSFDVQSSDLFLLSTPDVQTVEVGGDFHISTTDTSTGKLVTASLDFKISGNVVYVLRHINELIMDCSISDPSDIFLTEFCQYSLIVASNDNVKDFGPALVHFRNAILSLNTNPPSANPTVIDQIFTALTQAQIVTTNDSVAFVSDISLKQILGLDIEGTVQLKLTNNALTLEVIGASEMDEQTYQNFKLVLEDYLIKFQDGDQATLEKLYEYSFLIFSLIEGFLS